MSRSDLSDLQQALGHTFADRNLLRQALTHSSLEETREGLPFSNERLEFLGDRVLGLVIARYLYDEFAEEEEGALSRRHTALVRREALARVAEEIGLSQYLIISDAEEGSGGRDNQSLLANGCEALIAALFLDAGYEAANGFILRYWQPLSAEDLTPPKDPKTALQEWAQGQGLKLPDYRETGRTGPSHSPLFTIEVVVDGFPPVSATGTSKRAAQQAAAESFLDQLTGIEPGIEGT